MMLPRTTYPDGMQNIKDIAQMRTLLKNILEVYLDPCQITVLKIFGENS